MSSFVHGNSMSSGLEVTTRSAGPKAVCQYQAEALPAEASDSRRMPPAPPANVWDRPWVNFMKAQRHFLNLAALEAQAEADFSPMHVMQRDETIASIARVRVNALSQNWLDPCTPVGP